MTEADHLAAEYALGLLEGEDLLRAQGAEARDPAFAGAVARWQAHFAPLLDEVAEATPRADLWLAIEAALGPLPANDNEQLSSELRRWKWATALASAAAAVLLAVTLVPSGNAPVPEAPELAASIPVGDSGLRLEVTYIGDSHELVVAAAGLTADGVHDHELWLIPPEGDPLSLGVIAPGSIRKARLDDALAAQLTAGRQIAVSREPLGGAPKDAAPGPVVAQGVLTEI